VDEQVISDRSPTMDMPPAYDPSGAESRWYREWDSRGYFQARANSEREPFCIVIPPPNVTGALHMGHALGDSVQDAIIRRKRMQGYETLWLPGTDHAGIATQVVVERELAKEGIDRHTLGREAFVERAWKWKEQYGNTIIEQIKALGCSCDWTRLRFTMDEGLAHAVRVAFVRMYGEGLIYRGERIINWCPRDTTALSDSEVDHEDVEGELVTFRYDMVDGSGHIDVATTRIETMLGDTGVAVHPGDERYRDLIGKSVRHPFDGRELPIVADEAVQQDFGTGAVKVTPAHDPTDFEIGQRHGLDPLNVLTAEAKISDAAPQEFRGLDRYEARARVLERLQELGRIVKVERPYVHSVGHCYRCHTEIEPWLSGKQWFVAVDRLKGPAKEAALDGRITFWPERWVHPYVQWMDGLRDWNISRQLWWGHRIPVWYCPNDHQFASVEDPAACVDCGSKEIEQDPDVLDTWFSSQLWPFSTMGWPEQTEDLAFFYPTSVLVTAYDILYLWVARMIMSGLHFMDEVPFHHVAITGLVRDRHGKPMHKSSGNVVDPLDLIARYGADATRFGLLRMATGGQDMPLQEEGIESARRFANKIWNASRLVLSSYEGGQPELPDQSLLTLPDRWLLSRHEACLEEVDAALDEYRYADAAQALYHFFWSEFCDWGLEAAKPRLYGTSGEEKRATSRVLAWVAERSLRLLHPMMPFVTEEIWQRFGAGESIMIAPWPEQSPKHFDEDAEERFSFAQEVVSEVRRFRKAHALPDSKPIPSVWIPTPSPVQAVVLNELPDVIKRLANLTQLNEAPVPDDGKGAATLVVQGTDVLIDLADLLDAGAERSRLAKRIAEVEHEAARRLAKLSNEQFVAKAPPELVERERDRLSALEEEADAIRAQLEELN
jgi:valyl-tRNA synthetase